MGGIGKQDQVDFFPFLRLGQIGPASFAWPYLAFRTLINAVFGWPRADWTDSRPELVDSQVSRVWEDAAAASADSRRQLMLSSEMFSVEQQFSRRSVSLYKC